MRQRASSFTYDDELLSPRCDAQASMTERLYGRMPASAYGGIGANADDDDKFEKSLDTREINDLISRMDDGSQQRILKRRLSIVSSKYSELDADDDYVGEVDDDLYPQKVKIILAQAIPAVLCSLANQVQENVNLIFIGQLNNPSMMAGVGMGNMVMNVLGLTIAMGLNGALETFTSQAFGSGNLKLCALYLNRGRVILLLVYIPITLVLLQSEYILIKLGQDAEVAGYTLEYIKAYLPGLMLMGLIDGQRRFLNMMNQTKAPMAACYISISFHIFLSYIFVWKLEYGILGTGYASTITNLINYVALLVLSYCIPDIHEAIALPDSRAFYGLFEYLRIGIPSTIAVCLQFWVYDFMILMAGCIGVKEQACQIIVINITSAVWMVSVGFQQAASSSIGQQIGKGDLAKAKSYHQVLNQLGLLIFAMVLLLINLGKKQIIGLFTENVEIIDLCTEVITIAFFGTFPDLWQGYAQGVVRALGMQNQVIHVPIIGYWLIQIPGALYCVFYLGFGHKGMWISMVCAQWFIATSFQYAITNADWDKSAADSKRRQQAELLAIKQISIQKLTIKPSDSQGGKVVDEFFKQ